MNYLPGLASNCDPSNLSLPISKDYRREPLVPGNKHSKTQNIIDAIKVFV
jgi:hypothetical protein